MLTVLINVLILICLIGGLVGFLWRRKTPRAVFFGAVFFSIVIFFIGYWMVRGVLDQYSPDLEGGPVPYLIAVAPVVGFLSWFLKDPQARKK
jgi:uncharacterized membrane protein YfcA